MIECSQQPAQRNAGDTLNASALALQFFIRGSGYQA